MFERSVPAALDPDRAGSAARPANSQLRNSHGPSPVGEFPMLAWKNGTALLSDKKGRVAANSQTQQRSPARGDRSRSTCTCTPCRFVVAWALHRES